jgi:hypothetical protein
MKPKENLESCWEQRTDLEVADLPRIGRFRGCNPPVGMVQ